MQNENSYQVREADLIQKDISEYLKRHEEKDMLRFLVAGSVDDGKSTLIGRLLYDSKMIYEDQFNALKKDSVVHNTTDEAVDLALLTDGLKAEREQGITIDVAYRYFNTERRSFIICDSPGHEQYTRNMVTGASHCQLAIVMIDARHGVMPQTRRHSLIAELLGIKHVVVIINKMDAVDWDESVFRRIRSDYEAFASKLSIGELMFIPVSALKGDNVVDRSVHMPWYQGRPLLNYLEEVPIVNDRNLIDFRFPVQYVMRPNLNFRGFAGNVASGNIRVGEEVTVLPSGQRTRIKSIETFDGSLESAFAPMAVVLTTDTEVDISRGSVLARTKNLPNVGTHFEAMIVWMNQDIVLRKGERYLLKSNTQTVPVHVDDFRYKLDINELSRIKNDCLEMNEVGRVKIVTHRPLIFDDYSRNRKMGSFILIHPITNATAGAGMIIEQTPDTAVNRTPGIDPVSKNISKDFSVVSPERRHMILGHQPATLWFTGLSGSGKTTLARAVEARLAERGICALVLDGDNLRHGLNKDLGFSVEDRIENIRRVSEVAKLLNDAGVIVITALISPFAAERMNARRVIGDKFFEIHLSADLSVCRSRDPKGLYRKVAAGEISNFTGVDSAYEAPESPELRLDTAVMAVEEAAGKLIGLLISEKVIP